MRLDLFLKSSRLIPRRSLAQKFCDAGLITINDATAKSSREVKEGDTMTIKRHDRLITVKILKIPSKKQVSKDAAPELYEIVSSEPVSDDIFPDTGSE
ncbi:MAG: RNA-binding S4 domain-containing protein [Pyrinomonadaceae bacterium]|nr:RNA-binding S4 domain-containing protein [Pyrinomonadaceae bacterium]